MSAPWRVRLPPHTLRMTTAGRMACSARQLVASSEGSHKKRNTAGNSVARCAAKRSASSSGGPQHRGGIVEPPAGADGVDRRVRGDERPQPVADAADAPAGLVRRDHGRVADLLAQLRVGRRGGAGRPVQHVGEAARRDLQAERGPQQVGNLRQRHPHLRVQLDDQRDHPGTELHARRAQRVGGLQHVVALHPPLTLRAVADLDVEAPHDRAHHGQLFLILRRHAGHFDRAAAVRTRRRNRRRVGLVDPRRARAAAVAAILRTGPPSGTPPRDLAAGPWQNGAACRRPARRASSNCRFRRSTCCFRRSFSRCRRSFLRCCPLASRSRRVNCP